LIPVPIKLKGCRKGKVSKRKPKRCIKFAVTHEVRTFVVVEGEREDMVPHLSSREKREMKREMDAYKEHEMEVHPGAAGNTRIERLRCLKSRDVANRRAIKKYEERNRTIEDDFGPAPNIDHLHDFFFE
jgi:hypothetical protein